MSDKHRNDIENHVRESVQLRAAYLMQRACNQQTRDDGAAVYSRASELTATIVERLLREYRVTRKPRTERTVQE